MDYFLPPEQERLMPLPEMILREDGAWIPPDPANRDWIEYQDWLAAGNQPKPYSEYVPPSTPVPSKTD